MTRLRVPILLLILGLATLCKPLGAADPLQVAGKIVRTTNSTGTVQFGLLSHRNGELLAILEGNPTELSAERWAVLQVEETDGSFLGYPILRVVDVFSDRWAEPDILDHFRKGFGAYSGQEREQGFHDYAGQTFEDRIAYRHDTGERLLALRADVQDAYDQLSPSRLTLDRSGPTVLLSWPAAAGVRYDLLAAETPDGPFSVLTNLTSPDSRTISFTLTNSIPRRFFRLHY